MTPSAYNQALLEMATQSLAELTRTGEQKAGKRTPAQESHFLCTWMAASLKEKRFSRLVMEDLKGWVQLGRTLGAGADLKGLLERIVSQYQNAMANPLQLGSKLANMLAELEQAGGLAGTDRERSERQAAPAIGRSGQSGGKPQRICRAYRGRRAYQAPHPLCAWR